MSRYKHTESEIRVMRAIGEMPYGALVTTRYYKLGSTGTGHPRPVTLDEVANYLESLGAVLREHAENNDIKLGELAQLTRDVEGMRRLIGR